MYKQRYYLLKTMILPVQRLQMSDDFFGKLLLFGGFFRLPHFSEEIPPHDFEANQVPRIIFPCISNA